MVLRHRAMEAGDILECVDLIATHPVVGPRYGTTIKNLGLVWMRLLRRAAAQMRILEEKSGTHSRICFVGVSVCIADDFLRDFKSEPLFWFGPEFIRRALLGDFPCLSDQQLREANSFDGLNMVVWEGCIRSGFEQHSEIHREIMHAFINVHRGYLWKELIASHMESVERLKWTLDTGGRLWDPNQGRYVDSAEGDLNHLIRHPHIVGVTRGMEHSRPSSWVGELFRYSPPKLGLPRSEQQLLVAALDGATDEELSERLRVSLPVVKKKWLSVYNRVETYLPELLPAASRVGEKPQRGKEKRRTLLAYLREYPEELRPVSRKFLQRTAGARRHVALA